MANKQLNALKKERIGLQKQLDDLSTQIGELEKEVTLPVLRQKYEGKWFKHVDRGGESIRITEYNYVLKVTALNTCQSVAVRFDYDKRKGANTYISFEREDYQYLSTVGRPCKQKEIEQIMPKLKEMIGSYL